MVKDEEVHRTTLLWRSTVMVRKLTRHICGAKPVALMSQTCAREGKRVGDERDAEAIDESYHFRGIGNQIVSYFMKLRVPGSIDGKDLQHIFS